MKVQSSAEKDKKQQRMAPRSRSSLAMLLVTLNAFVLGGCFALLIVNRLLTNQRDLYFSLQSDASGSAILDFMEDLLPLYLICGSTLLLLLLFSAVVWTWTRTQSRFLRYGSVLLLLLLLVLLAGIWLLGRSSGPITGPVLATPTP